MSDIKFYASKDFSAKNAENSGVMKKMNGIIKDENALKILNNSNKRQIIYDKLKEYRSEYKGVEKALSELKTQHSLSDSEIKAISKELAPGKFIPASEKKTEVLKNNISTEKPIYIPNKNSIIPTSNTPKTGQQLFSSNDSRITNSGLIKRVF